MLKSKRNFRLGVCGALLGAVYLGLAGSAMAWNEPLWVRQLDNESFNDAASGVATDAAGNVYLSGSVSAHEAAAWLAKYDAAGHVLWKRYENDGVLVYATGVATDAAGNVYVTGQTDESVSVDAWVAKYDPAGDVLWKRQLGTEDDDGATGVATDAAGNVYVTGWTYGSLGGANRGSSDAWVAKYDASGRVLWKRELGMASSFDSASGVATDGAGNVYLSGSTTGTLDGVNRGSSDAWVAKYDASGRVLWKRQLGSESSSYFASGVATDAGGNVYVSGTRRALKEAAWLAKYDAAGHVLWKRELGMASSFDSASGVATDAAGNVYLSGTTDGSLGGANRGRDDAWVAKYGAAGHVLWKRQLGTETNDSAAGVATDTAGNVYLTGSTDGSLGGANPGSSDAWVAKYSTQR